MARFSVSKSDLIPAGSNVAFWILNDLGISIVTGKYSSPNSFPAEAELCELFGASRGVVREVLKMLTAKGMLRSRPRQGTKIRQEHEWNLLDPDVLRWSLERNFSLSLLMEFCEVRLCIEPIAAALAATRATLAQKEAIEEALNRMVAAERGRDDPLLSDIAFHVAILTASGNRFLTQFQKFLDTALRISIRTTNNAKGTVVANVGDHRRILDAIKAGDADAAQKAVRFLVLESMELMNRQQSVDQIGSRISINKFISKTNNFRA